MMSLGRQASVLFLESYTHPGLGRIEQIKAVCYLEAAHQSGRKKKECLFLGDSCESRNCTSKAAPCRRMTQRLLQLVSVFAWCKKSYHRLWGMGESP